MRRWRAAITELAARLSRLELEKLFALPERRGIINAAIRTLTAQIEAAKVKAMAGEGLDTVRQARQHHVAQTSSA